MLLATAGQNASPDHSPIVIHDPTPPSSSHLSPVLSPSFKDPFGQIQRPVSMPPFETSDVFSDAEYERRVRADMSDALKKLRAQNQKLTRSLELAREQAMQLTRDLEAERSTSKSGDALPQTSPRARPRPLSMLASTPSPEKRVFGDRSVRRSLVLGPARESGFHHRNFQSESGESLRSSLGLPPSVDLKVQLASSREELNTVQAKLEEADQRCEDVTARVSILQRTLEECLDSSARALELERSLRSETEGRLCNALAANEHLETENATLRQRPSDPFTHYASTLDSAPLQPQPRKPFLLLRSLERSNSGYSSDFSDPRSSRVSDWVHPPSLPWSTTDSSGTALSSSSSMASSIVPPSLGLDMPLVLRKSSSAMLRATLTPRIGRHAKAFKSSSSLMLDSTQVSADVGISDLGTLGLPPHGELIKDPNKADLILRRLGGI